MTVLETIHDTATGDPKRIKYDGDTVYVGFEVTQPAAGNVATVDCVGTYEIHDGEDTAFVDLEELEHALATVELMNSVASVQFMGIETDAEVLPVGDSNE